MAVTNYYTIDGQIIGEATSGARTGYLPDALGSVTATVDESGTVINTYRYKPYGSQLSKSGVGTDPKFQWVGQHGYRQTGLSHAGSYVRARHCSNQGATWISVDFHWPKVDAYQYADNNPLSKIDPSGGQVAWFAAIFAPKQGSICKDKDNDDYECRTGYRCFLHPGKCGLFLVTDPCCYADLTRYCEWPKCCMDLDGDGVCHKVQFEKHGFMCLFGIFGCPGCPGKRHGCYHNGILHYVRTGTGKLIACPVQER